MDKLTRKAKKVIEKLSLENKVIATAESCTGGMLGRYLTAIPGSSKVYGYGFITYSNDAKKKLLGVKEETLSSFGAVSKETVCEMAEGALFESGADIAVSISGIAGPKGATDEKEVGLVYVGVKENGKDAFYVKLNLKGNREKVRKKTAEEVFNIILKLL